MKTIYTILITAAFSIIFVAAHANVNAYYFDDENYIVDIPFDTETITCYYATQNMEFYFNDEPLIDDIPFDTECIAADCFSKKALMVQFPMENEQDIDDIPFDTRAVSEKAIYRAALEQTFYFEDEQNIDDIPFDTAQLVLSIAAEE